LAARQTSYDDLTAAFAHKNFAPFYLLYGPEQFFIDRLQALLLETALEPHERDFNLDIVYGAEADAKAVLGICMSYPLMAERRVVVVRDFNKLSDNKLFQAYAENPNPAAVVLFLCSGKVNTNAHPYRALKKHGIAAEFKALYPRQVPGWVDRLAADKGLKIEPRAVQMLSDFVGSDLRTVAAELEKLAAYAGDRETITSDDVVQASGQTRDVNVFELQRAVGEFRHNDTITIAERLLQQSSNTKGESTMIVAVLTSYFMKLWQLSEYQKQRISEKEMAGGIGVSPFFLKEYLSSLRRFDEIAIRKAFSSLLTADYELKGGSDRSDRLILNLMFRRLFDKKHVNQRAA
jgi:DNA polymerase-3 subunit delta